MGHMKIAYLTNGHPENRRAWSGLDYYMRRSLELAGVVVEPMGPIKFPVELWPERLGRRIAERALDKPNLVWKYDARVVRGYARQIEERLRTSLADAIFSPGSMIVSQLDLSLPIFFWSDATFQLMLNYYFPLEKLAQQTLFDGERLEQAAICNARHAFYASDWAASSAARDYDAPPKKLSVVPLGANIEKEPTEEEVERWIEARPARPCRFCLIGVDWRRKGVDLALAVIEDLRKRGLECEFTIIGCRVPKGVVLPPYARALGFVNNATAAGQAAISQIFAQSHFLLMPSRAECYGLVFAEASAHGVPSLASNTGGIPTAVRDGINGYTAPLGDQLVPQLASRVLELMADSDRYRALARSSYREYLTRLNWKTSGLKLRAIMEKNINHGRA
jgi:glycosyltransferase involved in cell wall biosynthesis